MLDTEYRCHYCGEIITDETMGPVEEYDRETHKKICFCDVFCRMLSQKNINKDMRLNHDDVFKD